MTAINTNQYIVTAKSTKHAQKTPHGYRTPHRHPNRTVSVFDLVCSLTKQLYPTGKAWYISENSNFENLHKGLNVSTARFARDAKETINSTIPDNIFFDESDVGLWEYRLGITSNPRTELSIRRDSVLRKLSYPAGVQARQHPNFIQNQLRLAGFIVTIYENTIPYRTPEDIVGIAAPEIQHANDIQHGDGTQSGGVNFSVIANSSSSPESYSIGGNENLWATFFIAGNHIEQPAYIQESREKEFRELVLKLKPAHMVAFININFT
jgi:hypothetical protein